ncbi:MAG: fibronectin type III domain-containing protein, partial [Thermoplasmata archaeon]
MLWANVDENSEANFIWVEMYMDPPEGEYTGSVEIEVREVGVVQRTPPSAPRNLVATLGLENVTLSWQLPLSDGGSPITKYRIYRGLTSGTETFYAEVDANYTTFLDENVSTGQPYYYQVSAVNEIGEGPKSNEASAVPYGGFERIHINGNADFASKAALYGWEGDGSQGNPYIIENYSIDGNGTEYCIWIENTDVYFVIRNCNVYGATDYNDTPGGTGIALNNVRNGTLENNKCNNSRYGIYLYGGSQYNNITNNNASGNDY